MEKKTPLYEVHLEWGGKIVPFAGYLLPVQYQGIIEEHMAVREAAGLFDVSHMGEVLFTGADALHTLNRICSNEFSDMKVGRVRYSPMLNPKGGVIDDLLIYKMAEDRYLMVVNAANREKDVTWILGNLVGDTKAEDISDEMAQLALQGPASKEILTGLVSEEALPKGYYTFVDQVDVAGISCLISRTGYTGSFGYELYCKAECAPDLWKTLMEAGKEKGLVPCGLGARDTLRLEASMPLYGHEMDDEVSPLETGLDFAVKMQKEDFIGKQALIDRGEPAISRVGLKVTGRGIIREDATLFAGETRVGRTTSGTHLPYLKAAYAMALVEKAYSAPGTVLEAEVRGRRIAAQVVELPFYKG
ncbi:MAG: gcvT [Firmicutes bacterium]|nr:gcvT [Bacillota bacterium]